MNENEENQETPKPQDSQEPSSLEQANVPEHKENSTADISEQKSSSPPQSPSSSPEKSAGAVDISKTAISRSGVEAVQEPPSEGPSVMLADSMDRKTFIKWIVVGWTAFAAIVGGYLTLVMRFLFPNVLFEPKQSFRAGYPNEYQIGLVSERWKAKHAVWIVRDSEKLYALSTVCTHLGCTPNWLENENKFKCPCHGSGFYKTGINFEGPAPRPLERFKVSLADDGEILVDKTRKFQQEKGEWIDPESFILV